MCQTKVTKAAKKLKVAEIANLFSQSLTRCKSAGRVVLLYLHTLLKI